MKKIKSYNHLEDSTLFKKNMKIHNNLWKVYTATLVISLIIIAIKGFN